MRGREEEACDPLSMRDSQWVTSIITQIRSLCVYVHDRLVINSTRTTDLVRGPTPLAKFSIDQEMIKQNLIKNT